ncbi:YceI family protein [Stenotrophomonas sp. C3(2023)]|uniref:YceI family protein n=1 Tax=Stenotrophomonas sp. C3(2023) TaxID=3080277 RepID=UPI00293C59F1|nr:YceI family protein [Stenotrophomonas sp. C3(2023)]MDV3469351.1 YceI family protein [Stenotrophomonas sp. C3(2023)]
MHRPLLPALLLGLLPLTGWAAADTYRLDPVHTRVLFAIDHAGYSQALGTVSGSEGVLRFDPDHWEAATLEVTVPLQRLELGDAKWNQATLAPNLLDGERYPQAHFVSTTVKAIDENRLQVTGRLTLRGVTRDVTLDVSFNGTRRYPLPPFRRTAGFSATTTLSRSAFGMTAWSSLIGDEVQLRIEAEASLDRSAAPPSIVPNGSHL